MEKNHMKLLIAILLDKKARLDERDDAVIDLANFHTQEALNALVEIASDPTEKRLWNKAGESIATIMYATGNVDWNVLNKLMPSARSAAKTYIESE